MASSSSAIRDELIDLLNDKSAPPERYRKLLSRKESGELILPTGFESVIAELEAKVSPRFANCRCNQLIHLQYKDTTDDNNCLVDIQTFKVFDGRDPDHIEPVSSEDEEELIGQCRQFGQTSQSGHRDNYRPESSAEFIVISDSSDDESIQEVSFVPRSTIQYNKLFLGHDSTVDISDSSESSEESDSDSSDSSSEEEHSVQRSQAVQLMAPNNKVSIPRGRQSWPVSAYDPPQYYKQPVSSLVSVELPSSSKIYDGVFQSRCLQTLKQHLLTKSNLANEIRADIEKKIMKTLGIGAIPTPESISILPFIHFDDNGEYHVSLLFDCPPYSPWRQYTRNLFGTDYIKLQKEVYELVRTKPGMGGFFASNPTTSVQSLTSGHERETGHSSRGYKSPIRTKVTQKKQKITSPNRKTVIELIQKEYRGSFGDMSTSDMSTTGSEFGGPERLYLKSMNKQPKRQLMLEMNGVPVKDRSKGRKAVTEKKVVKEPVARKSLPAFPVHFRDFERGASTSAASTSTPSTRSSRQGSAAPSSRQGSIVALNSRAASPEVGVSDDGVSSISAASSARGHAASKITFPTTSTPVRKVVAKKLSHGPSSTTTAQSKVTANSTKVTPPTKRPSEDDGKGGAKKRKSDPKPSTPKVTEKQPTPKRSSARRSILPSSEPSSRRPESRSDVRIGSPQSPNTSMRILRPRKSLSSPSKLDGYVVR